MPHAEVAKLIADNLGALPHPDPKVNEIRLMGYRPFNLSQQPEDTRQKVNAHGKAIGEGVVELLERNGKTIVDADELKRLRNAVAAQEPGKKVVNAYCQHCGCEVMRLMVDDEFNVHLHRIAQESAGLKHACWK